MSFPTVTYLNEQGNLAKDCPVKLPDSTVVKALETILTTRIIDERMITLQRQGTISFAMSSFGEEACAVGSAAALESGDWMYPQYREAGIMFWRGCSPQEYIHHMFCNSRDSILGRQMPNHFGSRKYNIVNVSSPIGTKIPHAAGCAYAMKLQKDLNVAICYFGEGATSEGDFHVGLNFAAVRKAPVIFFCRNNGYAISTPASKQFATDGVAPEGIGHGLHTIRVDGNDFFAVYDVTRKAREHALAGKSPVLIEAMTYRLGAHSTSDDPTRYRKEEELALWKPRDPAIRLRRYLEGRGLWSEEKEKQFLENLNKQITEAIDTAKNTCNPPLRSLVENVYFAVPPLLEEQYEELKTLFPEG